jgi:diguanylate cyclase
MSGSYHTWIVVLSILVAIAASHAALSLAQCMSRSTGSAARIWLAGGAISMGIGIWSMHFIAMMAYQLPIRLLYNVPVTLLSLALAIGAAAFALSIAREQQLSKLRLLRSAFILGLGISAMHYVGMTAITVEPGLSYDPLMFLASIAIAMASSFVALFLFFRLREAGGLRGHLMRVLAAVVMGCAIAGMHYTGMAATHFAADSICGGGTSLHQKWLAVLVAVIALGVLTTTTLVLMIDGLLAARARRESDDLQRINQQLQHAATHDALTGLPNRMLLLDRLVQATNLGRRHKYSFAVAAFDLDRFKAVNDTLGHAAGDELLRQIGTRITRTLRISDTLARMGGDEFVALLPDVGSQAEVQAVLGKVQDAIREPMSLGGVQVQVGSSIGVALFPADAEEAAVLLEHADAAMFHAKRHGRNNLQFYTEGMGALDRERLELKNDLRQAITNRELALHYQPKLDVASGRIRGAEALLRWRHPRFGMIPPDIFVPIAEENGMIVGIGDWVLREACQQLRTWQLRGFKRLTMAVNLSAIQLSQQGLIDSVRDALRDSGVAPSSLELELTESAIMRDGEHAVRLLGDLATLGVRIVVDDFGTGYSSLSHLRRLPLRTLKIDRGFISRVDSSRDDAWIVRAIVSLARSLDLKVTAEGVETNTQFEFVRSLGCNYYQGYLESGPLAPEDFIRLLQKPKSATSSRLQRLLSLTGINAMAEKPADGI